jgi:glutaconate CoA-transferase subunit A
VLPFLGRRPAVDIPNKSGLGTDVLKQEGFPPEVRGGGTVARKKAIVIDDPFGNPDDEVALLPGLQPDVSLIYAQQASADGIVRIKGLTFADLEQSKAASAVIVSCEEIVRGRRDVLSHGGRRAGG